MACVQDDEHLAGGLSAQLPADDAVAPDRFSYDEISLIGRSGMGHRSAKFAAIWHFLLPAEIGANIADRRANSTVCHTLCDGQYDAPVTLAMPIDPGLLENLRLELRRGCLVVAVLAQLRDEHYGYALRKALADRGLDIEENTLYPLLRRLEGQGLLASEW